MRQRSISQDPSTLARITGGGWKYVFWNELPPQLRLYLHSRANSSFVRCLGTQFGRCYTHSGLLGAYHFLELAVACVCNGLHVLLALQFNLGDEFLH